MLYRELHGLYKKALQKAFLSESNSQQLKELLQDFNNDINEESESLIM
ncbi:8232_t:CDS:1, partial [Funneliformis mosseae]